jgi:hypothetical protein
MIETAAVIVFFISIFGMGVIIIRKIPVLAHLPEVSQKKKGLLWQLRKKIEKISPFKNFSYDLFLQKFLTRMRILILKIENLLFQRAQKLKENFQKKKMEKEDDYWEEIKKEMKK